MIRRIAAGLVVCMNFVLLLAPFFAPYGESEQHRSRAQEKPTQIHWGTRGAFVVEEGRPFAVRWLVKGHLFAVSEPAQIFLLGTDEYGRDVFSRFLYGGRTSVAGGLMATLLALFLGLLAGALAGLQGGWVDQVLMRVTELFLSLPWLYLLLALRAVLPLQLTGTQAFLLVMSVIGLAGWPRVARLVRGVVLSAKETAYVQVARAMGASDYFLTVHHIWPHLRGLLAAQGLALLPQFVLADLALSFLGLGAGEPAANWGGTIASLRNFAVLGSHWGRVAPVALMMLFFVALQFLRRSLWSRRR